MQKETYSAYYYSFEATGCDGVDDILKEVARAGKMYHNTEDWCGEPHDDPAISCPDMVKVIQDTANLSASTIQAKAALVDDLVEGMTKAHDVLLCLHVCDQDKEHAANTRLMLKALLKRVKEVTDGETKAV